MRRAGRDDTPVEVPEPTSLAVLGVALVCLAGIPGHERAF
jgi:hypothetical protein